MELYSYFRSSASFRVRIALALKGLPYDYVPVHLVKSEHLKPPFDTLLPAQLIPLLKDGDALIAQSIAIIEYLDETHPQPPLLPADALGRARVRALSLDIACEIHPLNNLRVLRYLVREMKVSEDDKNTWYRHWVETGLETVERQLAAQPGHRPLLPRRRAHDGRRAAGAADLQRPAHGVPARPRADRDARVRRVHEARCLHQRPTLGLPGCHTLTGCRPTGASPGWPA